MRTDRGWRRFYATGWLVSAGVTLVTFRFWQMHLREVEDRAEAAERTREETAARRAVEERLRIARELHDSLTHSISVIQVQSGVAAHLARKHGQEVAPALLAIQEASGDAARELRSTLGVLRHSDDGRGSGLDRLPELLARMRSAGLPVAQTVTGDVRGLPQAVDQAAFRIVQEALTNVARHASPAAASVYLGYGRDALTVQVDNDGAAGPRPTAVPGLGLIGMRERVTSLGGRLQAGPRPDGGFRVLAELPAPASP
jgi:signal transduction histidine kinase